jgi:hypothetical protein
MREQAAHFDNNHLIAETPEEKPCLQRRRRQAGEGAADAYFNGRRTVLLGRWMPRRTHVRQYSLEAGWNCPTLRMVAHPAQRLRDVFSISCLSVAWE